MLKIKRVYEDYQADDGYRILIDRLWPRGVTKEEAKVDLWLKDVAPSVTLRKWFNHDPRKWDEFTKRYTDELKENKVAVNRILEQLKKGTVTLLYGARDTEHNNAVVLKEFTEK